MHADGKKAKAATVIPCLDGRLRVFTDAGTCLGLVVAEHDVDTDTDADPVPFFRGLVSLVIIFAVQGLLLWLAFKLGTRWH
jgi:multisubunit Na+/H+ antiporter MnhC subunit